MKSFAKPGHAPRRAQDKVYCCRSLSRRAFGVRRGFSFTSGPSLLELNVRCLFAQKVLLCNFSHQRDLYHREGPLMLVSDGAAQ
jgi:hypothetical protein